MSVLLTPEKTGHAHARSRLTTDPISSEGTSWQPSGIQRICRRLLLGRLAELHTGRLTVVEGAALHEFGRATPGDLNVRIVIRDPRAYSVIALGGSLGAAEAYMYGYWETDDLFSALRLFVLNATVLSSLDRGAARLLAPARMAWRWARRNTPAGSRRNIAAHYDLSNDFFALMLDSTMTYSSAIFDAPEHSLQQASTAKYERICRKLQLSPQDHVLEIGSGWGGFAIHAAREYGCHVTTTTISRQQYEEAEGRIQAAGVADRVRLLREDYRALTGCYDKLVSIEMIEAVGENMLGTFFRQCSNLLRPQGMMVLQAITVPDYRYDDYRRSIDFINRYVFPGGFLPSWSAMLRAIQRETDFQLLHMEDFGDHYARTLSHWRQNFWSQLPQVRSLGFDAQFIRMWDYYLCYCEAGFRERLIGVSQSLFAKPLCRRPSLLAGLGS
ncbi:MAG: class I SAM-dependent methyltransferase [Pirellulaceae bacterium]